MTTSTLKKVNQKKAAFILGTRPEIIKLYPLIKEYERRRIPFTVIHTNQHYDKTMDRAFFEELELPLPRYDLNIGSSSQARQTGSMMAAIEKVLLVERPDVVFVQGDTNTVLAGGLAAAKLGIKVAHVEAGLRSYDRSMPEEINRVVVDHISDYLFCPSTKQASILSTEGITQNVHVTGNTIVDAVMLALRIKNKNTRIQTNLSLKDGQYFLLTCHRPSNTDNSENFETIMTAINEIALKEGIPCVLPLHPRLENRRDALAKKYQQIHLLNPLGYCDLLHLQQKAKMIFTDSGGIQEEACILQKKCLVLRLNTERPEALEVGGADILSEITVKEILNKYHNLSEKQVNWRNPFGDGQSVRRIVEIINE